MMQDKIVSLKLAPRGDALPAADPWQRQIDARLSGIERLMRRLEWQVWALVCGAAGLLVLDLLRHLTAR